MLMMMAAAIAAQAEVRAPLQPTGVWRVDLVEGACNLSRSFGNGEEGVTVSLRGPPLGSAIQFLIATNADGNKKTLGGKTTITLFPSGQTATGSSISGLVRTGDYRLTSITFNKTEIGELGKSTVMTLAQDNGQSVRLALNAIGSGLNAFEDCNRKLLERWNIDPAESDRIATPAKPKNPEGVWLTVDDYPIAAIRARQQGTTTILFTIALDGHARNCKIVATSGTAILDAAACNAMETRARYTPALDKDGKPMISHKARITMWLLPDNMPR